MAQTQLSVANGDVVKVSGLPVQLALPAITSGKYISNLQITAGDNNYTPGQTASMLPSDNPTISYTEVDIPVTTPVQLALPEITAGNVVSNYQLTVTRGGTPTTYNPGDTVTIQPGDTVELTLTQAPAQTSVEVTIDYTDTTEPQIVGE